MRRVPACGLACAVALVGGCGAVKAGASPDGGDGASVGDTTTVGHLSGSRLRARIHDGGDGATVLRAWHDTELGVDCGWYSLDGDGTYRCAPTSGYVYYRDEACTDPVIVQSACEQAGGFAVRLETRPGEVCGVPSETVVIVLYEHGDPVAAPSRPFRFDPETGGCLVSNLPEEATFFELGPVKSTDGLVPGTLELEAPRGQPLALTVLVGGDGSRQALGLRDVARDERCNPIAGLADGSTRCVPDDPAASLFGDGNVYYADAACTERVARAAYVDQACGNPSVVTEQIPSADGCDVGFAFFEAGAEVASVFDPEPTCAPLTLAARPANTTFYALGPPLDVEAFVGLDRVDVGTGRLAVPYHGLGAAPLQRVGSLIDREREGARCDVRPFASDGALRCLPSDAHTATVGGPTLYADAGCTIELEALARPPCGGTPSLTLLKIETTACGPSEVLSVHTLAEALPAGQPIFYASPGVVDCGPADRDAALSYHPVSAPIGRDEFPAVIDRIE